MNDGMKQEKAEQEWIEVYGARVHNLRNIDVRIPRNKLTVITGLSGSGKSSLAFIRFMPKVNDATSKPFRHTLAILWAIWNALMWTKLQD